MILKTVLNLITPTKDKLVHHWQWDVLFFSLLFIRFVLGLFDIELHLLCIYFIVVITAAYKELVYDLLMKKGTPELKDFFSGILTATVFMLYNYL